MGVDSNLDFTADESFFCLKNIYKELSDSKTGKIFAFSDSCFSGVTDGKAVLKGVVPARVIHKSVEFDKSKMVVMSAGKSHQYSNGYSQKGHRLFSFYVMKDLIEGKNDAIERYNDVKEQTYLKSVEN